jgi:hypothetical protein
MDISSAASQQSGLAPLYPQTQQELKSESQSGAESSNPVEQPQQASNEQQQAGADNRQPQENGGQIDTYA